MKKIQFIFALCCAVVLSCSSDDSNNDNPTEGTTFTATINGASFSNYTFEVGVYTITKGTNGNTLSINVGDLNGEQLTLFLNGTDGFDADATKIMGNTDTNNFTTYGLFRQQEPQISYFSSSGNVTITENRSHPKLSGKRLISGEFDIKVASSSNGDELEIRGSFSELEYDE